MRANNTSINSCIDECMIGQILDGLLVGVILTNEVDKVIWMNRAAEHVLDADRSECIGQPMRKVLRHPQLCKLWDDMEHVNRSTLGQLSLKTPQSSELKYNCTRWRDPLGVKGGRALLFCDVTEDRNVQVELSQAVAHRLLDIVRDDNGTTTQPTASLTPQELRMLALVGQGLSNQHMADEVCVSTSTVRFHLKNVYRKLHINSRSEAVSYAVKNGLS